ncbi:hypothetical protein [Pseudomonas syringae]|uniref:Uncharacterized protein n=1 Tax=Pseudomonas syringae pv. actinidiae TaxID=103796 RepID=A0A2V0Q8M5_PSESF|nr:hypothetical protein [Pseudomonas syringae]BBI43208.1 hypothetical protein KPSA1B_101934 [Pseudomonas syringae pv. actinidiae]GBH08827.1 hypothetical protein KPSA1_02210 [Pseudomonas syringae pv. actinidiae]
MTPELTEEEMRRALFGDVELVPQVAATSIPEPAPEVVFVKPAPPAAKKKAAKAFTPRLRVTLRVGNEFEGKTFELIHDADTLSKLLAEQEAVKAARKKFRYVEVVSVISM